MRVSDIVEPRNKREPLSCKVGTFPRLIYLYRRYRIRKGLRIKYRYAEEFPSWRIGYVWEVHTNGYFKVSHTEQK